MRVRTRLRAILSAAVMVAAAQLSLAEDSNPPDWRGETWTSRAAWTFDEDLVFDQADEWDGPGSGAKVSAPGWWQQSYAYREGIRHASMFSFELANYANASGEKQIWVQLVWKGG